LKAKKSYGQHFLNSEQIAQKIADSLEPEGQYTRLLEIGPGRGMLTKYLLEKNLDLITVEADLDMVQYLQKNYPQLKNRIIAADFLKVPLDQVMENQTFGLIGNFPYNISSQILFKMLEFKHLIPEMVGMFQKEVAERVVADPGSKTYGVISVLVQAEYTGEYLFTVDKKKFTPPPKVQSAVIRLRRRPESLVQKDPRLFRQIVKQSFGQRRKMLRNTIKQFIKGDPFLQSDFFRQRPEQLSVQDFVWLTGEVKKRIEKK
jgi:16S rRNA (adenine1518-N6/adenine1519-N6)-dimethyltransferase